jgi:hypothetical protein
MANKGILALGGLAALAYLAASKSPEVQADLAALGYTGSGNATVDEVLQGLKNSSTLRTMLKGEKGETGLTGPSGIQGLAGEAVKAFASSLVKNSAAELGTLDGWTAAPGVSLGTLHEGLATFNFTATTGTNYLNGNSFFIDNRRLLKVTCMAKTDGATYGLYIRRMDKDDLSITQGAQPNIFPLNSPTLTNTNWEQKTAYFGGTSTTISSAIGTNTAKGKLNIYVGAAGIVSISHLCVQHVSLGEPVPYNLAYLPDGQVVYEPTTGKLGRYNGTAVVWNG